MNGYKIGDVILDRYAVTDTLGQGGMGYVLAAQDRRLDRLVALKFLLTSLRDKPAVAARFEREARTATRIVDAHVAQVHNVELTPEGVAFIVMEHLRGENLASVIRARGPLGLAEAVDLLLQACEAIAQAHKLGIVHRDLKPSNLFLTKTFEGTPILKVLDFGIAKALFSDDASLTATDAFVGSPAYMSPEQLDGLEVDARSDVWALGVILYEMLAGEPPFTGPSVPGVCRAILEGRYANLAAGRPEISASFDEALSEALAIDRDWRLPSVEAFAAKFAPFGTELARASHARIRRIASTTEAHAEVPKASTDASVPLAAVGATSADGPTSVTQEPPEPSPPPRQRRALRAALGVAATAAVVFGVVRYHATPTRVGAPQDVSRAAALYESECNAGSGESCNRVGGLYARGEGVAHDDPKAFALYDTGCRAGNAAACVNEGTMLYEGKAGPRNYAAAAPLFQIGCDGGEPIGCRNVGVAYHEGHGASKNLDRAYEFAGRACRGGALAGCTDMAAAKVLGEGVAKDVKGGLAELDALCKRGETSACDEAASLDIRGAGTDVPADPLHVREVAKTGCVAGSGQDCQMKQTLGAQDRTSGGNARAWALFQTQCDAGTMSSCGMLGESLVSGSWGVTDRAKGMALLAKACKGGYAPACKAVGDAGGG